MNVKNKLKKYINQYQKRIKKKSQLKMIKKKLNKKTIHKEINRFKIRNKILKINYNKKSNLNLLI